MLDGAAISEAEALARADIAVLASEGLRPVPGTLVRALATGAVPVAGVEAMQQRLCAAIEVGMQYEQLHDESHRQVAGILRQVGISRLSSEELVARGVTRAFYPHGLGHSLGLQTHDVGCALTKPRADNPFLRNTSIIEKDQVFTIEPGAYLPGWGGVRIEDDVLVTETGVEVLTDVATELVEI